MFSGKSEDVKAYWLVKFVKSGALEVIPFSWKVNDAECWYPKSKKSDADLLDMVKACGAATPRRNFKKYTVKYMFAAGKRRE